LKPVPKYVDSSITYVKIQQTSLSEMLFIVVLSHVITTLTAHIQVSFQLMLCSKYPPISFDAYTKSGEICLLFTRYSGYFLQMRWIQL